MIQQLPVWRHCYALDFMPNKSARWGEERTTKLREVWFCKKFNYIFFLLHQRKVLKSHFTECHLTALSQTQSFLRKLLLTSVIPEHANTFHSFILQT